MTTSIEAIWDAYMRHKRDEEGPKPTAAGTLFRVSSTGSCLRQRAFQAHDVPETEGIEASTLLAFGVGHHIHDTVQQAVLWADPDARIEEAIDLTDELGVSLSGHTDGVLDDGETILEIKTISSFAAKLAKESGLPKAEHVAQAALYALGVDASQVLIVYIAKESDFRSKVRAGDTFEWLIGLDEPIIGAMTPRDLALREIGWITTAEAALSIDMYPAAFVPDDNGHLQLVETPAPYGRPSKGGVWQCRYCRHNTLCRQIGPDEVPVEVVQQIAQTENQRVGLGSPVNEEITR